MKLLMISGDTALAQGKRGPFYYMLEEFSKYWERVDIICPKIRNPKSEIRNVHGNVFIHSSPRSRIFQPWFILKKGIEIYKKEKFDIFGVHSYPPFYNDIGGRWLCKKLSSRTSQTSEAIKHRTFPYILEVMHISGCPKAGNLKEWVYKILTKLFIKWSAKKAKAVRVINQKQTPEFLKKAGIPEEKIKFATANYIDLEIFKFQDLPKKYDIVFSGRLVKNKGIFLLLKAIKYIKQAKRSSKRSDQASEAIKLIIIGSGPLEKKIRNYIKKHKLEENIELAGWLPTIKDLAKIYNQSKILVMPSFNEGGPRVTLEAMACKTPIITTRIGAMVDVIEDPSRSSGQGNGLFIDWNSKDITEKILMLLKDEKLYKKIAENGYQTVQQFERKKAIKNYATIYQKLID